LRLCRWLSRRGWRHRGRWRRSPEWGRSLDWRCRHRWLWWNRRRYDDRGRNDRGDHRRCNGRLRNGPRLNLLRPRGAVPISDAVSVCWVLVPTRHGARRHCVPLPRSPTGCSGPACPSSPRGAKADSGVSLANPSAGSLNTRLRATFTHGHW
jgi:hypothetical protein